MLYKKMLRDISDYKIQFISVLLMAFIGVFIFTGISGEALCLESNINNYYSDSNLADGWIYSTNVDNSLVEKVNNLSQTTDSERQLVVTSWGKYSNDPEIKLHFIENNTISKFYLIEGEELNLNDTNGVWIDKSFADAKNLKIGDNITFKFNGMELEKEIKGIGYSPEYVYNLPYYAIKPNYSDYGYAYMSYKAFPSDNIQYNVLNVKYDGNAKDYSSLLSDNLKDNYNSFVPRGEHISVSEFQHLINQYEMIAKILPFVFIFVSFLMLVTSMKRIISHQRTQIGILKANGFKNRTIMVHYISYGFLLVLAGSLMGLILGPIFIHNISYASLTNVFKLPYLTPVNTMNFAYVVIIMVLLSVIVSYFSIRSIVNEHPSNMIRPKAPKATTSSFIEKFKFWHHLSFNLRWNYRDVKRNNFRAIITILGVLGCTVILISAFGLNDGLNNAENWQFNEINHYESKLIIDIDANSSQIDNATESVNGEKIMESAIEIEANSEKEAGSLLVLNETDLITPTDINQNRIEIKDNEVSISQKMADLLHVGVGDTVNWHIKNSDKWVELKIDRIHGDPTSQGLIMSKNKLDELGLNYTPTSIISSNHVDKKYDGIQSTIHRDDMIDSWWELYKPIWMEIYALIFFAIFLAVIVLYNLGLLSFLEMKRDIGTLKVLGFKTRTLTKLLLTQSMVFIIIGGLLGIPLGFYILNIIWKSSSKKFFIIPSLSFISLACTFIIILVVSIGINLFFAYKIKKLDMVDTLKILE